MLKNSFLIPHPLLSVQSSRENHISGVELWRNGAFRGELPGFGFGDSQCGAPQLLHRIVPSFTKMCTLRLELPVLAVQRGPPHDLTKTVKFEQDLNLI